MGFDQFKLFFENEQINKSIPIRLKDHITFNINDSDEEYTGNLIEISREYDSVKIKHFKVMADTPKQLKVKVGNYTETFNKKKISFNESDIDENIKHGSMDRFNHNKITVYVVDKDMIEIAIKKLNEAIYDRKLKELKKAHSELIRIVKSTSPGNDQVKGSVILNVTCDYDKIDGQDHFQLAKQAILKNVNIIESDSVKLYDVKIFQLRDKK